MGQVDERLGLLRVKRKRGDEAPPDVIVVETTPAKRQALERALDAISVGGGVGEGGGAQAAAAPARRRRRFRRVETLPVAALRRQDESDRLQRRLQQSAAARRGAAGAGAPGGSAAVARRAAEATERARALRYEQVRNLREQCEGADGADERAADARANAKLRKRFRLYDVVRVGAGAGGVDAGGAAPTSRAAETVTCGGRPMVRESDGAACDALPPEAMSNFDDLLVEHFTETGESYDCGDLPGMKDELVYDVYEEVEDGMDEDGADAGPEDVLFTVEEDDGDDDEWLVNERADAEDDTSDEDAREQDYPDEEGSDSGWSSDGGDDGWGGGRRRAPRELSDDEDGLWGEERGGYGAYAYDPDDYSD